MLAKQTVTLKKMSSVIIQSIRKATESRLPVEQRCNLELEMNPKPFSIQDQLEYRSLQSTTAGRAQLLNAGQDAITEATGSIFGQCTEDSVSRSFAFQQSLGHGTYGNVCRVVLKNESLGFTFPIALKKSLITKPAMGPEAEKMMTKEERAKAITT